MLAPRGGIWGVAGEASYRCAMTAMPSVTERTPPICPYCAGASFARLHATRVSAHYPPPKKMAMEVELDLELLVCVRCGKTDLFALDLEKFLSQAAHELGAAATDGPYR
jgi:hypothetical protein